MYWLKILHEILGEAKEAGEMHLGKYATDSINIMVSNLEAQNSEILKVYQIEEGGLHQGKHLQLIVY